jgi:hypothetical protein
MSVPVEKGMKMIACTCHAGLLPGSGYFQRVTFQGSSATWVMPQVTLGIPDDSSSMGASDFMVHAIHATKECLYGSECLRSHAD